MLHHRFSQRHAWEVQRRQLRKGQLPLLHHQLLLKLLHLHLLPVLDLLLSLSLQTHRLGQVLEIAPRCQWADLLLAIIMDAK